MPKQYDVPTRTQHVSKLERIQRMATKRMPELKGLQYEEKLREMNLQTLEQSRERGFNTNKKMWN